MLLQRHLKMINSNTVFKAAIFFAASCATGAVYAQTRIYVDNQTDQELRVESVEVSGHTVSKSAWKKGANTIKAGERVKVLSLTRESKTNWMDPTARFIEPGKTAVFTTVIGNTSITQGALIKLRQKLTGTGKSTLMWHSIQDAGAVQAWQNDEQSYVGSWMPGNNLSIDYRYRAYKDQGKTHVEYIFTQ